MNEKPVRLPELSVVYASEPGIIIPALLYVPEGGSARKPAMLVVNGAGKAASAKAQERFARAGMVVLSVDARGLGETRSTAEGARTDFGRFFGDYDSGMTAMLIGKTLAGMRAEDIARGLDLLAARPEVDAIQWNTRPEQERRKVEPQVVALQARIVGKDLARSEEIGCPAKIAIA